MQLSAAQIDLLLVPGLPLIAGLLCLLAASRLPARLHAILGAGSLLGSSFAALQVWRAQGAEIALPWINLPDSFVLVQSQGEQLGYLLPFALRLNLATLIFALSCALIAAAVIGFALRERRDDPGAARFIALLTAFAGAMLLFVCSDTFLVSYVCWEAMGLLSYLLIAHPGTEAAKKAARQAFWTTRVTDFGFLFAILILMSRLGWTRFSDISMQALAEMGQKGLDTGPVYAMLSTVALLTILAALGKAAQLPLSFWLADAMEAPAPVSALLHSATMVAAGPFLLFQFHSLFITSQSTLKAAVLLGGITMLGAGLMALFAADAKRLLAYSTISQLGLCIMSVGVLAEEAGMFQLSAHAWLKAALFLTVGYLAAMSQGHSSALAKLAGSARRSALAGITLAAGLLGLCGIYGTGGFWGKEQILLALFTRAQAVPQEGAQSLGQALPAAAQAWSWGALLGLLGTLLTAAYSLRLLLLLYRAPSNGSAEEQPGQADGGWQAALLLPALLAFVGCIGLSIAWKTYEAPLNYADTSWRWVEGGPASVQVLILSTLMLLLGAAIGALSVYSPQLGQRLLSIPLLGFLQRFFANGMYLREFWLRVIAVPGAVAAWRARLFEQNVIDTIVEGTGQSGRLLARASAWTDQHIVDGLRYRVCDFFWEIQRRHSRWLQTGSIQHYMLIIFIGAVILCFVVARPLANVFGQILGRY